jgi:hypothetical protein
MEASTLVFNVTLHRSPFRVSNRFSIYYTVTTLLSVRSRVNETGQSEDLAGV